LEVRRLQELKAGDFMSRNVLTMYQHQNVSHAIDIMAKSNVGSVVVLDNTGPCGVFTERDLLAKVIAPDRNPESTIVMEVLSPSFPAIGVYTTAEDAAATMISKKNRLMVLEGADLVGIITPTDFVRLISNSDWNYDIGQAMSKRIVSVYPETPISVAVKEMREKRVGSVMVSENDRPIGIFTERDLLKKVLVPKLRLNRVVKEVMSTPLVKAEYGTQAREAAKIMMANRIKRLPLFKADAMVGIITARDLVEVLAAHFQAA
jgi:CBS domain-containing protein